MTLFEVEKMRTVATVEFIERCAKKSVDGEFVNEKRSRFFFSPFISLRASRHTREPVRIIVAIFIANVYCTYVCIAAGVLSFIRDLYLRCTRLTSISLYNLQKGDANRRNRATI